MSVHGIIDDAAPAGVGPHNRGLRRARIGVTAAFAVGGGLVGVFTARIPALMDEMGLSTIRLGVLLLLWGLGAVATMQTLRWLMPRIGSAPVLRVAAPLSAVTVALVGWAATYGVLLAVVTVFGMAFGALEVAAKAQGSAVENGYGRPLMGLMHAGWPVGAGLGGLAAAACAGADVSYAWTLVGAAAVATPVTLALGATLLHRARSAVAPARQGRLYGHRRVQPVVYLLGVVAFGGLVLEGAVTDWTGVHLHDGLGASQALAALAYPMFQAGMLAGRLGGDRLRARFGARTVIIGGAVVTAMGMVGATSTPDPPLVLAAVFGTGVALGPVTPMAFSLAGAADRGATDTATAQLGVLGYAGIVAGPALIGGLAHLVGLRTALGFVAVLLATAIATVAQLLPRSTDIAPMRRCTQTTTLGVGVNGGMSRTKMTHHEYRASVYRLALDEGDPRRNRRRLAALRDAFAPPNTYAITAAGVVDVAS